MSTLISDWIGKKVHVTLRTTVHATLEGLLVNVDTLGVLLEIPKGQAMVRTLVPFTSIIHISVL